MNREEIRKIKKKVEKDILSYPGVTGVDIGYKTVGGKKTDVLAIIIYVKTKHATLKKEEMLPKDIEGIPVDVVQRSFKKF